MVVTLQPDAYFLCLNHTHSTLFDYFIDNTGAHGTAAFTNRETKSFFHRDRGDQLTFDGHVVARHYHLHTLLQIHHPGHIRGPEVKLRPIAVKKRGVTTT